MVGRSLFMLGEAELDPDEIDEVPLAETESPTGTEDPTPPTAADATLPAPDTLLFAPDSLVTAALPPPSAAPKIHPSPAGSLTAQATCPSPKPLAVGELNTQAVPAPASAWASSA
ncbi:hypothetical protein PO587_27620 [Streptomyces gilvifuscus]|uniref:Uncharacterized protein n=1 Tax=Streptomyces gilvifuscus TaxID=1550617 RepID=A0ABT5G065_9ACTN|nr:hypothetical protein [Streptomyces gilvifuscus]MDC2958215.1 hypothetical protein [Streptomyces gilvifuscus]